VSIPVESTLKMPACRQFRLKKVRIPKNRRSNARMQAIPAQEGAYSANPRLKRPHAGNFRL
jgi:hypothetical protein